MTAALCAASMRMNFIVLHVRWATRPCSTTTQPPQRLTIRSWVVATQHARSRRVIVRWELHQLTRDR